ncbi:hypothetical protein EYF80_024403 [Liparis tanakae]|uniref:Uncharacterized protein n=1 Tax=Liparis tanakae TaxID=230148 RepID=A0A4Z2HHQ8_9TELE|nr:hypothetical protein EYF80_024403 [Liparis tanakae]
MATTVSTQIKATNIRVLRKLYSRLWHRLKVRLLPLASHQPGELLSSCAAATSAASVFFSCLSP